jgi:hypothetical protein
MTRPGAACAATAVASSRVRGDDAAVSDVAGVPGTPGPVAVEGVPGVTTRGRCDEFAPAEEPRLYAVKATPVLTERATVRTRACRREAERRCMTGLLLVEWPGS